MLFIMIFLKVGKRFKEPGQDGELQDRKNASVSTVQI